MGKEGNQRTSGIIRLTIFLDTLGPKITVVARVQQCLRVLLFGYSGCPSKGPYKKDKNTTAKACFRSCTSHCFSQVFSENTSRISKIMLVSPALLTIHGSCGGQHLYI